MTDTSTTTSRGRVRVEPGTKRVRAVLGGQVVVDTTDAIFVWEGPHYPQWYVPVADVADGVLAATATQTRSPSRGTASLNRRKSPAAIRASKQFVKNKAAMSVRGQSVCS